MSEWANNPFLPGTTSYANVQISSGTFSKAHDGLERTM